MRTGAGGGAGVGGKPGVDPSGAGRAGQLFAAAQVEQPAPAAEGIAGGEDAEVAVLKLGLGDFALPAGHDGRQVGAGRYFQAEIGHARKQKARWTSGYKTGERTG